MHAVPLKNKKEKKERKENIKKTNLNGRKKNISNIFPNLGLVEHHDLQLTCMANTAQANY